MNSDLNVLRFKKIPSYGGYTYRRYNPFGPGIQTISQAQARIHNLAISECNRLLRKESKNA